VEPELVAILGVMVVLLAFATLLYIPDTFQDFGNRAKKIYEDYVDWIIVVAAGIIALIIASTALGFYLTDGNPRDAYIAAAVFIYLVKMALTLLDTLAGEERFLLKTMAHIMDLAILCLLFMGVHGSNR